MKTLLGLFVCLCVSSPVTAQTPIQDAIDAIRADTLDFAQPAPEHLDTHSHIDLGLTMWSITASGVAMTLTVLCVTEGNCIEANRFMRKLIGRSMLKAIAVKGGTQFVIHYLIWRFVPKSKIRTGALAILAGINTADAAWDWHIVKKTLGSSSTRR